MKNFAPYLFVILETIKLVLMEIVLLQTIVLAKLAGKEFNVILVLLYQDAKMDIVKMNLLNVFVMKLKNGLETIVMNVRNFKITISIVTFLLSLSKKFVFVFQQFVKLVVSMELVKILENVCKFFFGGN